jgi:hypothetical protein
MQSYEHDPSLYPWCVLCRHPMKKAGRAQGFRNWQCRKCIAFYRDGARLRRMEKREKRRYLVSLKWDQVLEAITEATAQLPADVREEVIQEMALAALTGDLDLACIPRTVPFYRRKVSRQMTDRFRVVSLDQPIGADGMTYGELLAG